MGDVCEAFGSLSVVIPAYNAQQVVCNTLDAVQAYLESAGIDHEIIVVDDGSKDKTADLVERRGRGVKLLQNDRNRGKGYTVRRGMLESRGAWALFMDVDNAISIDHLDRFARRARDFDVLVASRRLEDSRLVRQQPRFRQMLGRTFPYIVRLLALPEIRDTQCGFKVFRRKVAQEAFSRQRCWGFCFDVEVLLIAARLGYRIAEIPVDWDNPAESTIRLGVDPARMLLDLIRIVRRNRSIGKQGSVR